MKNKWKVIAIIFIILFTLETILFITFLKIGLNELDKENECAIDICMDYDAYYYESYTKTCYCYKGDEVAHQKYMK